MPATRAAPSLPLDLHSGAHAPHAESRGPTGSAQAEGGPFLRSDELLQGRKAVAIAHNGFVYRLQATRLGKLILTK